MRQHAIVVSQMAHDLIGSEILKISGEIQRMMADGIRVANFTVGDFNPADFPIPDALLQGIIGAYQQGHTNYPPSMGTLELRKAVAAMAKDDLGLSYATSEILIAGGARPLIYGIFITLLDAGDKVLYGVPSWNNNHYSHLAGAMPIEIRTTAAGNFMVRAQDVQPHLADLKLLVLNSPLNPTGTAYDEATLRPICDMVLQENQRRAPRGDKPLYILYDRVYWRQTYGRAHVHPVALVPQLKDYVLYVDGITKCFAATGLRVGWVLGPEQLINPLNNVLGHVGAWAPKPEQMATARFLGMKDEITAFVGRMNQKILLRLDTLSAGIQKMKKAGLPVDCVAPQGGIYLSVLFNVLGYKTQEGRVLTTAADVRSYLLEDARCGLVPFSAFGVKENDGWFRVSVGAITDAEIEGSLTALEKSLRKLKPF
jgi:aspartate aminotransferase